MSKTIIVVAGLVCGFLMAAASADEPVPLPGDEFTAKEILDAERYGLKLAEDGNFDEAAPYLDKAAKLGQKEAQARLGFMFLNGEGVKKNELVGISWLGTAARGESTDMIKRLFDQVWTRIPEDMTGQLTAYIDTFETEYGESRIECRKSRVAGSHISTDVCEFGDKWDTLREVEERLLNQADIGTRRGDGEISVEGFMGGP
ncbi:MAG: hypothetical protein CMQ29_16635 [Gammaproteobacteria bacterium]|nr:hypothetical protein [Gammaproteobacteria bacterium]MBF68675.1 hypothetical protein [Gammaproteobacteria bacterium]MBF69303.1 hypothetical protein [Gammaproteobacteria bacterium]